jgi:hypothetical protein
MNKIEVHKQDLWGSSHPLYIPTLAFLAPVDVNSHKVLAASASLY